MKKLNNFVPKTERIKNLAKTYSKRVVELASIFDKKTAVYIDYANVIHWSRKLNWHIDLKRLKQLFDSFSTIKKIKLYNGTLVGNQKSEDFIKEAQSHHFKVVTKPVKIMRLSIDVSSVPANSPAILQNFIKKPLLQKFNLETIEYLNSKLKELNAQAIKYIEHKKCNFDVEIGRDMLLDYDKNGYENFILWSGDSDFADPVSQLLKDKKKVTVMATARRISIELSKTGALIFEINKIRDFICWKDEISEKVRVAINAKRTP